MHSTVDTQQALDWLAADTACLTMAGAGISIPAPACAPGVAKVMGATIDVLRDTAGLVGSPGRAALDPAFRDRLLPESCYGAIAASVGKADHLRLWQAYAWTGERPDDLAPQPNAGHHLLAGLAARHALPVLTTNFDLFLETAARRQGRDTVVGLPVADGSFPAVTAAPGGVAVWKLHGTALDALTLRSQPADLVRSSYQAVRTALPVTLERVLIVGYSGRDFDVFPWLAEFGSRCQVLWVDLSFPADHRSRLLPNCLTWQGSFEDLAREFFASRGTLAPFGDAAAAVRQLTALPESAERHVREAFAERVRLAVRQEVRAVVADRPRAARLALAAMLNTVADFPQVIDLAQHEDRGPADVRTLLAVQFAQESMDLYRSAEATSRTARRLALRAGDATGWGRAEIARAYSRFRRHNSSFNEPEVRTAHRGGVVKARAIARLAADALLLAPLQARAMRTLRHWEEDARHYDALAFACDYTEHLIRIAAASARLGRTVFAGHPGWDRAIWGGIGSMARRVGYMRGMVNVAKYRARSADGRAPDLEAVLGAEVVGDLVAGAIATRDAALRCLAGAGTAGTGGTEAAEARERAHRFLLESIAKARLCRTPSLVLKDLLILKRYGFPSPLTADETSALIDALEGEVDRAGAPVLRALLG
ncbi:SIR2 family protein [Streptomyces sp. AM 4-1-1]|uniref:SIR2 family protein n=1 Tax=Streptomyces sp. AM 4-1-1 TaxID=3028710 RepID=UPI0023B8A2BD|nr:SIR2 family protein [Streptomyces sp. AM 4-1-1]WEH32570.1 SIR2 family protein [Streptomyces sp. AM 4-1-1]